jgi:nucleoside-diphosphate-sugar epimerase
MSRILITGSSGFIGTHCLQALLCRGHELHAVSRSPRPGRGGDVTWHCCDLGDPTQAAAVVTKVQPTHLLHIAWIAKPGVYASSVENFAWMQATLTMAAAFGSAGGRRFLGIGTSAEYDPSDQPCIEDATPIRPNTVYGKCKAATWLGVQAAAQHYGFAAAWARLFFPYGPGDAIQRLVPYVTNSLIKGAPVLTTLGLQIRDFIYARDAAELISILLLSEETGAFNIGTGVPSSIRSVVEHLAAACGRKELVQFGARQTVPGDPKVLVADMSKVHSRLGWSAPTDVRAGLDRVLATMRGTAASEAETTCSSKW